jgi:hypothetical protein
MKLIIGVIAISVVTTAAQANTVAYNAALAAGYYNGTGNPNVGFTTDTTASGIQLGLGVNLRFVGPVLPTSTNNYTVPLGTSAFAPAGAAIWDFEYSVDFGSSGLTENNTDANLTVLNTSNGQSLTFDPSFFLLGDATNGNGYQNAENLGFSFVGILAPSFGFDPTAVDEYIVTLSLADVTGAPLASVTENINAAATPLPASLPLLATGLGGLGLLGWRKKRKAARAV